MYACIGGTCHITQGARADVRGLNEPVSIMECHEGRSICHQIMNENSSSNYDNLQFGVW